MTPGPWRAESHIITRYPDISVHNVVAPNGWKEEDGSYRQCSIAQGLDDAEDALLIASAPDLLEACKLLTAAVIRLERLHKECIGLDLAKSRKRASTAIAKAEGRKP